MKEVTKEKFYAKIGPMDVEVCVVGKYPYKTEFRTRSRVLVGYTQDYDDSYPVTTKYFLVE